MGVMPHKLGGRGGWASSVDARTTGDLRTKLPGPSALMVEVEGTESQSAAATTAIIAKETDRNKVGWCWSGAKGGGAQWLCCGPSALRQGEYYRVFQKFSIQP